MNKKISTPIAIGIILILVIIVGSFTWWQYGELNKEETNLPEVQIPEKEVKDETANWSTYRNDYYGFEFKYPPSESSPYQSSRDRETVEINDHMSLDILPNNFGLTAEQCLAKDNESLKYFGNFGPQEPLIINGEKAIKVTFTFKERKDAEKIFIYLSKNDKYYRFSFYPVTEETDASELAILDNVISTFKFLNLEPPENLEFNPLISQPSPSFIKSIKDAIDIKIDLHYEGDYEGFNAQYSEFYTPKDSNERFLSLSKIKKLEGEYIYGPEYYSVFTSEESHSYQGTPIYLFNSNSKYSVSYIGFKINNRELISDLKVEFGIDYLSSSYYGIENKNSSIFAKIFGVETVYACGPGLYLRKVGDSNLTFVEESNGVTWYQLEKPVALYNLNLSYCDRDCKSIPNYCHNWADDPAECDDYWCCEYNASISNLKNGNLRMHIYYQPNDKDGLLKLQMVSLILSDSEGSYYQPIMGENFNHYYRAYLH